MQWKDTGGGSYQQPPIGTHLAICVKLIDIGHKRANTKGRPYKRQSHRRMGTPQRTDDRGKRRKPFTVSKFYTASLSEGNLPRKDLANWRGRDFTPQELGGFAAKNILGKALRCP